MPRVYVFGDEVLLAIASLGTGRQRQVLEAGLEDVAGQLGTSRTVKLVNWLGATDPCFQIADYCAWAAQRKYERGDDRSYRLIEHKVETEYDLFRRRRVK